MKRVTERCCNGFIAKPYGFTEQQVLNRLAEYEDAEEQGLLVRLPYKYEPMQRPPDKFDSGDSRLMEWIRKNGISVEVTDA